MNTPDNGDNRPQQPQQPQQPQSGGYPYSAPNSGQSPYGNSPYGASSVSGSDQGQQVGQANDQTAEFSNKGFWAQTSAAQSGVSPEGGDAEGAPQGKKGIGATTAIAIAVVASLVSGGVAGYVAGNSGGGNSGTYNALENPSVSSSEPAPEGSVEAVADKVLPAVVSIQVATMTGEAEGSGSIISSDGLVLTNHHVVSAAADGAAEITVTLNNGQTHRAEFVGSDVATDIAVIQIEDVSGLPVLDFGDSDQLKVGQEVVAVGSPLGLSATVTSGIVSALNRPVRASQGGGESSLIDAIQTDAAINPGNSGGPLVDMDGNLIGMNSVIASLSSGEESAGSIGLGFAIPSNFARRVADQLVEDGEASQPMLGVQVNIQSPEPGATIVAVEDGGPADEAGLNEGDVVTKLNDRVIQNADDLIAAARSQDFGETVTLEVHPRDSEETRTVDVTLSSE